MYDLIIIGGGPAGVAAGVYAARKQLKSALITESFGGQSLVSANIQNWIGVKSISGFDLAKALEEHIRSQQGIDIFDADVVVKLERFDGNFRLATRNGKVLEAKTVLIVSGSRRRKLNVPGEEKLNGKGVAYCSTCDAPIFKDKTVAVVGGGNAGLEAVVDLLPYTSKIYLLEFTDSLKGDIATQGKVKASPTVEIISNAKTLEILGIEFVAGLRYEDQKNKEIKELKLDGVFVEIGSAPNSDFVKDLVQLNKFGEIIVDHKTQRTSQEGIWAAGDVCDVLYKQNNISAGDAIKAVLNIYDYLNRK
jgi:alkyl hydroperoxide reductase subunit F